MDASSLVSEIIEAHGARALWSEGAALEAEISAREFLFTAKGRPRLDPVRVTAEVRRDGQGRRLVSPMKGEFR